VRLTVKLKDVLFVGITIGVDVLQELNLVKALVEEVFVVRDDLDANLSRGGEGRCK
jgi:hypothetical protein